MKQTTLDKIRDHLGKVGSATRPEIAASLGLKIRTVNRVVNDNLNLSYYGTTGKMFDKVGGSGGKGSHTNPMVIALAATKNV